MSSYIREYWLGGLTFKELARQTWSESNKDNIFGTAAELAYYFLLALFPLLIFLTSLIGFMEGVQEKILYGMAKVMPPDALSIVRKTVEDVATNRSGGLISLGILGTLWAASSGVAAVIGALNTAYDTRETRSFVRVRLTAIGITIALSLLVITGTILIMSGDRFSLWLSDALGLGPTFAFIWRLLDNLIGLALLFIAIELVYYLAPNTKQQWAWITPGALFAIAAAMLGSLLFSLYLQVAPSYSATYGSLGAVIVLMLWLYLMGLVLLLGAEINAEIAHATGLPRAEQQPVDQPRAA